MGTTPYFIKPSGATKSVMFMNTSILLTSRPNIDENYFELGYYNNGKFVIISLFKLKDGLPEFL